MVESEPRGQLVTASQVEISQPNESDNSTRLTSTANELDSVEQRPIISVTSGCMYAFFVVAFSGAMIFVNALACLAAYPYFPEIKNDQIGTRIGQLFFFTVPLIMLIIEWHLIDRLRRLFRSSTN